MYHNQLVRKFFSILSICLCLIPLSGKAQASIGTDLDSDFFQLRVKHIEDFMGRFNYKSDARGQSLVYHDSLKTERAKSILSLFSKPIIEQYDYPETSNDSDTIKNNLLKDFIASVALDSTNQFLKLTGNKWAAECNCLVTYNGRPDTLVLFLGFVFDKELQLAKWVVDSCKAPFLNIEPHQKITLSPVSHNMNFMQLGKATELNPELFPGFANDAFDTDYLSIVFFAIKNKLLTIDFVANTTFHFWQIPGYYFTVENIIADDPHSGWLITSLKRL